MILAGTFFQYVLINAQGPVVAFITDGMNSHLEITFSRPFAPGSECRRRKPRGHIRQLWLVGIRGSKQGGKRPQRSVIEHFDGPHREHAVLIYVWPTGKPFFH